MLYTTTQLTRFKPLFLFLLILLLASGPVFAAGPEEIYNKGKEQLKQKKYEAAVKTFTTLIEKDDNNPKAYKDRGFAYLKLHRFDPAISDFKAAKRIDPEIQEVHTNLGAAWFYKKEYKKAIASYNRETSLRPDNGPVYFNRALALAELEKVDKALVDLEKAIALKPAFYWAFCLKGDLLARKAEHADAFLAYKNACATGSDISYAQKQLADLKTQMASLEICLYSIQSGAFLKQSNAQKYCDLISNSGYKARIERHTDKKNRTWHFVRTGWFRNIKKTEQAIPSFKRKTGAEAIPIKVCPGPDKANVDAAD